MAYKKMMLIPQSKYDKLTNISMDDTSLTGAPLEHDTILSSISKNYKARATSLLELLERSTDISWTDKGTFIFEGVPAQHSNIADLIRYSMRDFVSFKPVGITQYVTALAHINVPESLIGNLELAKKIRLTKLTINSGENGKEEEEIKTNAQKKPPGLREEQTTWISY